MEITNLKNSSTSEILKAFNLSFSDYVIPLQLTEQQFQDKLLAEDIDLEWSFGAFEENKLVGLILHGFRNNKLYNAGTGVIPEYRGNKITQKLYDFVLEKAKLENITTIQLEVITDNSIAIKTYQNIGFEIIRTLNCYKGTLNVEKMESPFEISELNASDFKVLNSLSNYQPTWQNSPETIENLHKINTIKIIGVLNEKEIIGHLIFNTTSKKIHLIGINENYDRTVIVNNLFKFISDNYFTDVLIINIDDSAENTISSFNAVGLNCFLKQYEMKMDINKKA
ncbi:GNAT family N-acetyltransferase [Flavobacterium sp.]|uniref:GNAT family N-acetyltransferase n=1 Tax=Flavobacterium sp. TaxID=239 RepID=UPI002635C89E|nr:GNAT family N-acetyltransferase [Flavobacterium sp.]